MRKPWRTLIIDDEDLARERLKRLISVYDNLELIGEASNGAEGLEKIETLVPDLIFLDIEMPVLNGFEMLARLKTPPKVIFTTAYDQYAVKAFEEESIDYLLKPIEAERLEKSIRKLEKTDPSSGYSLPLELLLSKLNIKKDLKTLTVKIGDKILLIKLTDLCFIEAEDKYVFLHTLDSKKHLTDFTITALEDKLPEHFVRISRGTIINTEAITEIRKAFNGTLFFIMNNQVKLSSSRGYTQQLKDLFEI